MANVKRVTVDWRETGITVYCIVRREVDNFLLNDANGSFATSPADPYLSLPEDAAIKGRYEVDESRTVWGDGRYTVAIYRQSGGSPAPVSDTIIATGELAINGDLEVFLDAIMRGTDSASTAVQVAALNDFNQATEEVNIGSVKSVAVAGVDDFKADCELTGSRTITIQLYETATVIPIADVAISVFNSDQTLFLGRKTTDSNGRIVIGRDDGTYKLVFVKAGVTFTVPETLTVTEDDTVPYFGDSIVIAPPADPDACRVFDYLFLPNSTQRPETVEATAEIQLLPYDKDDKLHSGVVIDGIYDPDTGLVFWDVVKGATARFIVKDFINVAVVVPDQATARLVDIPI